MSLLEIEIWLKLKGVVGDLFGSGILWSVMDCWNLEVVFGEFLDKCCWLVGDCVGSWRGGVMVYCDVVLFGVMLWKGWFCLWDWLCYGFLSWEVFDEFSWWVLEVYIMGGKVDGLDFKGFFLFYVIRVFWSFWLF